MEPTCIDLLVLCGARYKIEFEESHHVEKPDYRNQDRPWLAQIPCLNGHVGVWGNNLLVACTNKSGTVSTELRQLPFVEVVADGNDGINVTFDVEHFDEVAAIMKPRRRRRGRPMTNQAKQELVEAGRKFQFSTGRQRSPESHSRVQTGRLV